MEFVINHTSLRKSIKIPTVWDSGSFSMLGHIILGALMLSCITEEMITSTIAAFIWDLRLHPMDLFTDYQSASFIISFYKLSKVVKLFLSSIESLTIN